ncbi:hypothetical protein KAJ27_18760 [bacterium]|nr:hypothetical protein [bacterium]
MVSIYRKSWGYWSNALTSTHSPYMPPFRVNVEWEDFTMDLDGFGNDFSFFADLAVEIWWVNDPLVGD